MTCHICLNPLGGWDAQFESPGSPLDSNDGARPVFHAETTLGKRKRQHEGRKKVAESFSNHQNDFQGLFAVNFRG